MQDGALLCTIAQPLTVKHGEHDTRKRAALRP